MATLTQIRQKANAVLADFWVVLEAKQAAYYAKHGRYFQLLVAGSPEVENDEEYDFIQRLAPHEPNPADIDLVFTTKLPFLIQVDEWSGRTHGYFATVWVNYQGRTYSRTRDSLQNDTGWYVLPIINS